MMCSNQKLSLLHNSIQGFMQRLWIVSTLQRIRFKLECENLSNDIAKITKEPKIEDKRVSVICGQVQLYDSS